MSTPNRSASFSTIVTEMATRFTSLLTKDGQYVRIVADPNPDLAAYHYEEGLDLIPLAPQPDGVGGRHNTKVKRILLVQVSTLSNLDPAGRDEIGSLAHFDLQDAVIAAATSYTLGAPTVPGTAVNVKWIPSGDSGISRRVPGKTGLLTSRLAFEILYAQPFPV